ncbi:MAG: hypothetical protein FJ405_08850 [Verrucomicrobia bacterium]|nr:hypothetical protein [Verrucomicrobiota bacterium]
MASPHTHPSRLLAAPNHFRNSHVTGFAAAFLGAGLLSSIGDAWAQSDPDTSKLPPPASRPIDFDADILPLFQRSCIRCHGPERPKGGFRLDQEASALKGGNEGIDIVPGKSADSRIVHYVAHLVPDMEMPPEGKGEKWTDAEVGLLRAWIDQGAKWGNKVSLEQYKLAMTTAIGGTSISGNEAKFREHRGRPQGIDGGIESLEMSGRVGKDSKLTLNGRLFRDDYKLTLELAKPEVGSIQAGWEQHRRYWSDVGGYKAGSALPQFRLNDDLALDRGRAWVDFTLNKPDWPVLKLGYEFQYRDGSKAMTSRGQAGTAEGSGWMVFPARKNIRENVHVLKLEIDHTVGGYRIFDQFRGEFFHQANERRHVTFYDTTVPGVASTQTIQEGMRHFHGMNALRVEKQFKDWLFGSAGYLYSRLDGEASVGLTGTYYADSGLNSGGNLMAHDIILERQTHAANVNALFGPWSGLTFVTGAMAEWTRQSGVGRAIVDFPFTPTEQPMTANSDKEKAEQTAILRFTGIPSLVLFAEGRLRQETTGFYEEQVGGYGNSFDFLRDTSIAGERREWKTGFSSSPGPRWSFGGHYRQRNYYDDYRVRRDETPFLGSEGYPSFIRSREGLTDEVEARAVVKAASWLQTTLTYRWSDIDFKTQTDEAPTFSVPGGVLFTGKQNANTYSFNAGITPWQRLHLNAGLTYRNTRTTTEANDMPSIAPFKGDLYSIISSITYVLTEKTDLVGSWTWSRADYGQVQPQGVPVGLDYDLHSIETGIRWKLRENLFARLQYGFYTYDERNTVGWNNYSAHTIFTTLNVRVR